MTFEADLRARYKAARSRLWAGAPVDNSPVDTPVSLPEPEPIRPDLDALTRRGAQIAQDICLREEQGHDPTVIALAIPTKVVSQVVASHYGVSPLDMQSRRRLKTIVRPRMIAMYLARRLTKRSLPEIGRVMGDFDHTTVLNACTRIADLAAVDPGLAAQLEVLTSKLMQHPAAVGVKQAEV